MAPPTYRQRVQRVLSNIAKDNRHSIAYPELASRVCPHTLRSFGNPLSTFQQGIRSAVHDEASQRRSGEGQCRSQACLDHIYSHRFRDALISRSPIRTRRDMSLRASRRSQVIREYESLASTLKPIIEAIARRGLQDPQTYSIKELPKQVRYLLETEQLLRNEVCIPALLSRDPLSSSRSQNDELVLQLNAPERRDGLCGE
uniref:Autophagy-related protein 11 n=1 Tax=Ganoderma boninense TaxID=34458 RepID=A0A5K1K4D2_9APHY|nr:Autophagy-related protein 11 [Ganoderma boninense]